MARLGWQENLRQAWQWIEVPSVAFLDHLCLRSTTSVIGIPFAGILSMSRTMTTKAFGLSIQPCSRDSSFLFFVLAKICEGGSRNGQFIPRENAL